MCFLRKLSDSSTSMNRLDIKLKDHKIPSDVTLVVKDGNEFQVHRSILSGTSSFFEKLLNSDMKENNEGVIRLEMILESQMADILEFIYTDNVQISTQENAENLFQLADYLLLPNLKAIAEKYLKEHITSLNCLRIHYLAEKYSCEDLINICRKFIYANFSSVVESDDFLNLSSQEVEKWISSDEIVIDAEEHVFELVLRWINQDESQRRVKFRDLFRHVRLTCVSRDFLASNLVTNNLVKEDEECLKSVFLALQWLDRSTDCDIPRPHPPRRALETDVIVVTISSNEPLKFHTNFYLPSTEEWYRLPPTSCKPINVFSHRGKVFVVTNPIARSKCYDPDLNRWSPAPWTKLDSNRTFRSLGGKIPELMDVLVNKDEIFFILAEEGVAFLSLWRYNINLNSMTSDLYWVGKELFCAVVVDKLLYAIGGYEIPHIGKKYTLSDSSAYDTKRRFWKEIAPMKEARIGAFGVSKNEEKIFIAGGIRPGVWLNSCEVYTIATNEWQFLANLTMSRAGGKMVLIDETIYVLGGQIKKPFKDACNFPDGEVAVEYYDDENDKWNDRTTMPSDKIFFRENPEVTGHGLKLRICSVGLFHTVCSKFTGLLPI